MERLLSQNRGRNLKLFLPVIIMLLFFSAVTGRGAGGLSGVHLRAPVGADGFARGGANTADPSHLCSWWNPAVLSEFTSPKLAMGTGYRTLGRTDGYISWEFRVPPRVGAAFSVLYRGDPALNELYDDQEYKLDGGSYTTLTFRLSLSYMISRKLSAGLNINAFYERLPGAFSERSLIYSSTTSMGGFDFAVRYSFSDKIKLGVVIKNIGSGLDWEIRKGGDGLNTNVSDAFPPVITAGIRYKGKLAEKPFIWDCDVDGYFIRHSVEKDKLTVLDHPQAMINNGFEWRRWKAFYMRAGVREFPVNGDMFNQTDVYGQGFTASITGGCFIDMSSVLDGFHLDYAFATSKIWSGVEQQLDFVLRF